MEIQKNESRGPVTKEGDRAIVQYKGMPITITFDDVTKYICPLANPKEVAMFLKTAQSLQLNPFANEIYLIKYSLTDKAAQVIAIDSYLKAAEANDQYDGHQAGIILKESAGKLEEREGAFLLDEESDKLLGGWARVYRKDRSKPYFVSVHKRECIKHRKDGTLTEFWQEAKQPWMLRKVALSRALVEAFPSLFAGLVPNVEYEEFPEEVTGKLPKAKGEMEEGIEPQAFYKNGQPDWTIFWTKIKELELTPDEVHAHYQVSTLKEVVDKGKTLDEIWVELVELRQQKAAALAQEKPPPRKGDEAAWEALRHPTEGEEKPGAAAASKKEPKPRRDPSSIKTIDDLMKACKEDFDLGNIQVLNEANARTVMDIVDPKATYLAIAAARQ